MSEHAGSNPATVGDLRAYVDVWFITREGQDARTAEIEARLESLRAVSGVVVADLTYESWDEYVAVVEAPDLASLEKLFHDIGNVPDLTVQRVRIARPH